MKTLCEALGIPSTSWVWNEALMAYMQAVCEGDDAQFKRKWRAMLQGRQRREGELKLADHAGDACHGD